MPHKLVVVRQLPSHPHRLERRLGSWEILPRASTSKADSVPRRSRAETSCSMAFPGLVLIVGMAAREDFPRISGAAQACKKPTQASNDRRLCGTRRRLVNVLTVAAAREGRIRKSSLRCHPRAVQFVAREEALHRSTAERVLSRYRASGAGSARPQAGSRRETMG